MKAWSLRSRLFVLIILPLIFVAGMAAAARFVFAERMSERLYDNTLMAAALAISRDVVLSEGDILAEQLLDRLTASLGDPVYYRISGPAGGFVTGYSDAPIRPEGLGDPRGVPVFFDAMALGRKVRVVLLEEFIAEPQFGGWVTVEVWQTVHQRDRLSLLLLYQSLGVMSVVIAAAALLIWFGINLGLKPLMDLREAVARRSPEDLGPIRRAAPREARPLVEAMNALFARLRGAFEARDAFIADAAHQLRNPVAALQTGIESLATAPDEATLRNRAEGLIVAARQASRLTRQLLALDRARGGLTRDRFRELDIAALARTVLTHAAERAAARAAAFSFEVEGDARPVRGDPVMLEEALGNLVDNAARYGRGMVAMRVAYDADFAVVTVADDGPGLPAVLRERVFDRFFRIDETVEGSGLGLAIARNVAQAHGGEVAFADVPSGAAAVFRLPLQHFA